MNKMKFSILMLLEILWLSPLSTQGRECLESEWKCPEDQCIARSYVCDGDPDCLDTDADEDPQLCEDWGNDEADSWWGSNNEEEEHDTVDNKDNETEETIVTTITLDSVNATECCVNATECCTYGAGTRDFFRCCNKYGSEWMLEDGLTQLLLVTELIKYYQNEDPKGIPGIRVPEPIVIRDKFNVSGIDLWDVEITGISGGKLDYLKVNLASLKTVVRITVPYINIIAQYQWPGYFCTSEGSFNITLEGFSAEAELDISGGILQYSTIEIDMENAENGLHLDFEGLCDMHRNMVGIHDVFFYSWMKPLLVKLITGQELQYCWCRCPHSSVCKIKCDDGEEELKERTVSKGKRCKCCITKTIVTTITPDSVNATECCNFGAGTSVNATECCNYGAGTRDFFRCCNKYNCYPTCAGSERMLEDGLSQLLLVTELIKYYQHEDPKGIPGIRVPEPIIIRDKLNAEGIYVWHMEITGISGSKLDYLKVNITSLKAVVRITVPYINIIGQYQWPGPWCTSEGSFNVTLEGYSAEAELDIPGGILRDSTIWVDMEYADNGLHLDFGRLCDMHSAMVGVQDEFWSSVMPLLMRPSLVKLITGQNWDYMGSGHFVSWYRRYTEEDNYYEEDDYEDYYDYVTVETDNETEEPSPEPALTSTPTPAPTSTECKTRDKCTDAGGVCKIKCDDEEELKERRVCKGKRCKCCITTLPVTHVRESMDDNGMVSISVPVEHVKMVKHYVDSLVALDYVARNHGDILPSYREDNWPEIPAK